MHGYSSEYPIFFEKKIIYIVYNMYMYHRIANKSISKRILKTYFSLYSHIPTAVLLYQIYYCSNLDILGKL